VNNPNYETMYGMNLGPVDPTRTPGGDPFVAHSGDAYTDPSIIYGTVPGVPYCASYNAELFKQLSPTMINVLKAQYPTAT
jgi:hypothetical protein